MNLKQWRLTQQVATPEGGKRTMTLSDAARRLGIHRATWFNYEVGKRWPSPETWASLFVRLRVDAPAMVRIQRAQRRVYDKAQATSSRKSRE